MIALRRRTHCRAEPRTAVIAVLPRGNRIEYKNYESIPYDAPTYAAEAALRHPTQHIPHQETPRTQTFHPGRYGSVKMHITRPQKLVQ